MAIIIRKPLPCNCGRPARIMHTLGMCTVGCLVCREWSSPFSQKWRAIRDWNRRRTSHRSMLASGTAFAETVLSERDPDIWECPVCFARTALANAAAINPVDDTLAEQVRQEFDDAWRKGIEKFEDDLFWGLRGNPEGTAGTSTATITNMDLAVLEKVMISLDYIPEHPGVPPRDWRSQWMFEQYLEIRKPDPRAVIVVNPTV